MSLFSQGRCSSRPPQGSPAAHSRQLLCTVLNRSGDNPHRQVTVVGCIDEVRLVVANHLVAKHRRHWGMEHTEYDPIHYLALGLYFDIFDHNIVTDDFEMFVAAVLRKLKRPILVVMDGWSVHRSGVPRLLRRFAKRVQIEWLPAYAPELNPVEQVWNRTKYTDLANYVPDDIVSLGCEVAHSIRRTGSEQSLLRSFFHHCGLEM